MDSDPYMILQVATKAFVTVCLDRVRASEKIS